jgi:hypothetical protein
MMNDFITPLAYLVLTCFVALGVFWATIPLRRTFSFLGVMVGMLGMWQATAGMPRVVLPWVPDILGMPTDGTMQGVMFDEPNYIYLLELSDGSNTPQLLRLPWNEKLAAKLAEAQKVGTETGTPFRLSHGRGGSGDDESPGAGDPGDVGVYPPPIHAPPPKIEIPRSPATDHQSVGLSFDGPEHVTLPTIVPDNRPGGVRSSASGHEPGMPADPHLGRNLPSDPNDGEP